MHRSSNVNGIFVSVSYAIPGTKSTRAALGSPILSTTQKGRPEGGDQKRGETTRKNIALGSPTDPFSGRGKEWFYIFETRAQLGSISSGGSFPISSTKSPFKCSLLPKVKLELFGQKYILEEGCPIAQEGSKDLVLGDKALHKRALSEINGI